MGEPTNATTSSLPGHNVAEIVHSITVTTKHNILFVFYSYVHYQFSFTHMTCLDMKDFIIL